MCIRPMSVRAESDADGEAVESSTLELTEQVELYVLYVVECSARGWKRLHCNYSILCLICAQSISEVYLGIIKPKFDFKLCENTVQGHLTFMTCCDPS